MVTRILRAHRAVRALLAALCLTLAATGTVVAWRIHERSQPCWAVRQFVTFHRDTQAGLKAKTRFAPPGSYDPDSLPAASDYQAWLSGLQQRAEQVRAPGLSAHAQHAAALAREFMTVIDRMNAELDRQDPASPALPPSATAAARINHQFEDEMAALAHACPA